MPPHIRPDAVVQSALKASADGLGDAENAARHGVAVKTIRRWRRLYVRRGLVRGQAHTAVPCPRCEDGVLHEAAYAELFGWYLGDGYVSTGRRGVLSLHIYNDAQYVVDNARIADLMRLVKPGGRPHIRLVPGCVVTTVGWKHWSCLLPQHGPGRKHERPIVLEPWQREIVERQPAAFLRGLFHSDGCRVVNTATRTVGGQKRTHHYPRWQFTNVSDDIRGLCCWTLDLVAVRWRSSNAKTISVSRRADVLRLDELIGLKS